MGKPTIKLPEKEKQNGINFLYWKAHMKSILQLKKIHLMFITEKKDVLCLELNKKGLFQKSDAMAAVLTVNCDIKIFSQFYNAANDNPCNFWEPTQTIQNQSN